MSWLLQLRTGSLTGMLREFARGLRLSECALGKTRIVGAGAIEQVRLMKANL